MGERYHTGREMTRPRSSGIPFGALSYGQLRAMTAALTPEEAAAPSARHYTEEMAPLAPEHVAALENGPLLPQQCPMPLEAGRLLLNPAAGGAENGYGILENGVGYAAIRIHQVGVTDEMIAKYREHFAEDGPPTLFYKLWYPGAHLLHYENGVVEDFGWGMLNLEMDFDPFLLAHVGLDAAQIKAEDPSCIGLLGLCGRGWRLDAPEANPVCTCMVQHTRQTETGRELRVRYWSGILFRPDGTLAYHVDPDRAQTLEHMRLMTEHCMREYSNELRLMRSCWKE